MHNFNVLLNKKWASNRGTKMAAVSSRTVPFCTDWHHLIKCSLQMCSILILVLYTHWVLNFMSIGPSLFHINNKIQATLVQQLWGRWTGTDRRNVILWYEEGFMKRVHVLHINIFCKYLCCCVSDTVWVRVFVSVCPEFQECYNPPYLGFKSRKTQWPGKNWSRLNTNSCVLCLWLFSLYRKR